MILLPIGCPEVLQEMNASTIEWTMQAARNECGWVCSDCGGSSSKGMPNECFYGDPRCNEIIARDKAQALLLLNSTT